MASLVEATEEVPLHHLAEYVQNPRIGDVALIAKSLRLNGQYRAIVANRGTHTGRPNEILAGNHTWKAAQLLEWPAITVSWVDVDNDTAARIVAVDNKAADEASYDNDLLVSLLEGLPDLEGTGFTSAELDKLLGNSIDPTMGRGDNASLAERFGAPPFTVLSTRGGEWKARKRSWLDLGIQSEVGRGEDLVYTTAAAYSNWYDVKNQADAEAGRKLADDEFLRTHRHLLAHPGGGTSVFDPALTELLYKWFAPRGGHVLDPWAGGSVRGIIAGAMGRDYTGVELRPEQVAANRQQLHVLDAAAAAGMGSQLSSSRVYMPERTPIEWQGGYLVKRDDTYELRGSRGGKVRSCYALAKAAQAAGATGLITAGSRQSPQVNIVATIASSLGMACRVHVPEGAMTPELSAAERTGATLVRHKAGYNNVIIARAREDAADLGASWYEIPFGMECQEAVDQTASQVASIAELPQLPKRIVVPVGSGMSAAGILAGLAAHGLDIPVLGVQVGADPTKRLSEYAPGWQSQLTLVVSELDYHAEAPERMIGTLALDPIYEAKCLPYLEEGDLLWVVGIRETAAPAPDLPESAQRLPVWIEGDSRAEVAQMSDTQFDMVIGCPPYYDLEVYSDDPRDLSNMTAEAFDAAMADTLVQVARTMKDDTFAVFVVGAVRDKQGHILDMRQCMNQAAKAAGLHLYNDMILLTPIGSVRMRAARAFTTTRITSRVHQEVLVYVKGDRKVAASKLDALDVSVDLDGVEADEDEE